MPTYIFKQLSSVYYFLLKAKVRLLCGWVRYQGSKQGGEDRGPEQGSSQYVPSVLSVHTISKYHMYKYIQSAHTISTIITNHQLCSMARTRCLSVFILSLLYRWGPSDGSDWTHASCISLTVPSFLSENELNSPPQFELVSEKLTLSK